MGLRCNDPSHRRAAKIAPQLGVIHGAGPQTAWAVAHGGLSPLHSAGPRTLCADHTECKGGSAALALGLSAQSPGVRSATYSSYASLSRCTYARSSSTAAADPTLRSSASTSAN